jgi:hypothetical protein
MNCSLMRRRLHTIAFLATLTSLLPSPTVAQSCEFVSVKQAIDGVLERDLEKLKAEVKTGSDSLEVVLSLVNAPTRDKIDICRYEASEYLAKRGFPPGAH